MPRRTVRPLKVDEIHNPVEIKKREAFDALIERKWGKLISRTGNNQRQNWGEYDDEFEKPRVIPNIEDTVDSKGRCLNQQPAPHPDPKT